MTLFEEINSGAEFSHCNSFRYALWRIWDTSKPLIMFVGLNPSTANASTDDPTIRRVKSMAKLWGYGGVYMMNCFPYISTNPKGLQRTDTSDSYNNILLKEVAEKCSEIIFAWGNFEIVKFYARDKELSEMFPNAKALIINKDGSPRHPLYVPASVIPIKYSTLL